MKFSVDDGHGREEFVRWTSLTAVAAVSIKQRDRPDEAESFTPEERLHKNIERPFISSLPRLL